MNDQKQEKMGRNNCQQTVTGGHENQDPSVTLHGLVH